jgi:hypothetical protein
VNNQEIGSISNGETLEFHIQSGQNEVQAKIDWCGSNTIKLDLDDEHESIMHLSSGSGFPLFNILFQPNKYLNLVTPNMEDEL